MVNKKSQTYKSNIYTKKGDFGLSSTIKHSHIKKGDLIFQLLGSLDEFNSLIGLTRSLCIKLSIEDNKILETIQNLLFHIGACIATNKVNQKWWQTRTNWLEDQINKLDKDNIKLKNFVIPFGSLEASNLFYIRSICRRVERDFWNLLDKNTKKSKFKKEEMKEIGIFLNRLSDFFFVYARWHNKKGLNDTLWNI